jgi:sugar lactone lactonase YvrE
MKRTADRWFGSDYKWSVLGTGRNQFAIAAQAAAGGVSVYKGKLVRYGPDGKLDRVVGLPVESTTSLSFGGAGLDVAYVTSMARAVKGVKPKEREAGALFAVYGLDVRGLPEPRFAG